MVGAGRKSGLASPLFSARQADLRLVNADSRAGHRVAIARNPADAFPTLPAPTTAVRPWGKIADL